MQERQAGVPMAKVIASAARNGSNDSFLDYDKKMIKRAYSLPAYSSSLMRQAAIEDWGHQYYIACKEAGY